MFGSVARHGVEGLAQRLKARRDVLGLSQADVGKRMTPPVSDVQVSNYESGRRSPSAQALKDLAKALECSADYLLGSTEIVAPEARQAPAMQALSTETPLPPAGTMPSLEEALVDARRRGKTYAIYAGQAYRLRKEGWEPV